MIATEMLQTKAKLTVSLNNEKDCQSYAWIVLQTKPEIQGVALRWVSLIIVSRVLICYFVEYKGFLN